MDPVGNNNDDARARIDRITYLASLVSDKNEIDQYLDKLRLITSRTNTAALSATDAKTLAGLEQELRSYLIHKEPLRSFTPGTLEQHLYERLQAGRLIRILRWEMVAIVAVALLATTGAALVTQGDTDTQTEIAGTAFICLMYFGGAYLFLSCLKRFSEAVQATYRLFTLGFVVGACTVVTNLIISIMYTGEPAQWNTWWPVTLGFPLSYLLFYFASRRLALLQEVKSWALNWHAVIGGAVVATGLFALLPGGRALYDIDGIPGAICFFNILLIICYNWLLLKAARQSSERYVYSTRALAICTFSGLVGWVLMAGRTFVGADTAVLLSNISNLFNVGALIFLFRAGYLLNKLSRE
jgi:hypothetical protein